MTIMGAIDRRLCCQSPQSIASRTQTHRCGGPALRLPILIAAAIAALWLNCGTTQAGRGLAVTDNPYCAITTYTMRDVPEQAMSLLDSNGRPVIVVSALLLNQTPAYGRFLWRMNVAITRSAMCSAIRGDSVMSVPSRFSISRRN